MSLHVRAWTRMSLILASVMMFMAAEAQAQQAGSVSGRIVDQTSSQPLGGAQIVIAGTQIGGVTNAQGRYTLLNVPAGQQTVQVQFIGFARQEQSVTVEPGGSAVLDFALVRTAIDLDRIVVTGTGAPTAQRTLGHTLATINTDRLQDAPTLNVSELLSGREPGLSALPTGGNTGEGARIRIRGNASLAQSNEPIIYVDGVRIDNSGSGSDNLRLSRLDDLNPEAIERIEVLKGAAAATLYGTEASSGVIQIFTKAGRTGAPEFTLSLEQAFTQHKTDRYEPHAGFARSDAQAQILSDLFGRDIRPYQVFEHNYWDEVFETGSANTASLTVSGGTDLITYMFSGRMQRENGPLGFERAAGQSLIVPGFQNAQDINELNNLTGSLSIFPYPDLRLRVQGNYSERYVESVGTGNCTTCPYSMLILSQLHRATPTNPSGAGAFGSIREFNQRRQWSEAERFGGSFNANYTVLPGLILDATMGVDIVNQRRFTDVPFGYNVDNFTNSTPLGSRSANDRNDRDLTFDLKASWDEELTDRISGQFIVGTQALFSRRHTIGSTGTDFPAPGLGVTGAAEIQVAAESILETVNGGVLGQATLGFDDVAYLTAGVRYDKHSAFGEQADGAVYPKLSLSLIPSDRAGWDSSLLSTLQLRTAIGRSGLQPGAFDALTTFSPVVSERGGGVQPDNLGNPDLSPEVSTEWEAGFNAGLLNDRMAVDFTYWNRTVTDLLVARQFQPSGGFLSSQLDNLGEMKAWGLEIGVTGNAFNRGGMSLDLFANASFTRERISDMGGAPDIKVGYFRYSTWHREGFAPGAQFGPVLDTSVPLPVHLGNCVPLTREQLVEFTSVPRTAQTFLPLVKDCGTPNEKLQYMGKPTPDWAGAFGGDLRWRNFTLTNLFEFRAGDYVVHNITQEFRRSHATIGRNLKVTADVESILLNPASTAEQRADAATKWATELFGLAPYDGFNAIENANHLRWQEVSLTYRVPTEWAERFRARNMSITAGGRNLALWTPYTGFDPASNVSVDQGSEGQFFQGLDGWSVGIPRRFQFSARVGF
jgi:TonB-dependent starch-binding outer membrane protein SusC